MHGTPLQTCTTQMLPRGPPEAQMRALVTSYCLEVALLGRLLGSSLRICLRVCDSAMFDH